MFSFFNNFLSPTIELMYSHKTGRCFMMIPKNGSSSMRELIEKFPEEFEYFSSTDCTEFLKNRDISSIDVFLRDPIKRFCSGLVQQQQIYGFDLVCVLNYWETYGTIYIYDAHTIPQFSYLLRNSPEIKFNLIPLEQINNYIPNCPSNNVSNKTIDLNIFSPALREKLDYFFTEDIVMYNQFLNTTTDVSSIVAQIQKEKSFAEQYRSYYKVLTYL